MKRENGLRNGSRIAVIGEGPAGSFFAYLLLRWGRARGIHVEASIFDPKVFLRHGLPGCNMCAGVLGDRLIKSMEEEELHLPPQVVRHKIMGYTFHSQDHWVHIPKAPAGEIFTVYRGQGPQREGTRHVSFDQFLLDRAVAEGARYERKAVSGISFRPGAVACDITGEEERLFDLAVGAFGVNSELGHSLSFGYRPPRTWQACQAELEVGRETVKSRFEDMIHVFTLGEENVKFVAFTPKEDFVTVSAVGRHVTIADLQRCLEDRRIAPFLSPEWKIHCHCHPFLPVNAARRPFAERVVIVGDAFINRYLKNGTESAFWTASLAARCVLEKGVSEKSLRKNYDLPCRRRFRFDNLCGKALFALNDLLASRPILSEAHLTYAQRDQFSEPGEPRPHSTVLWHTFTGDESYRRVLRKAFAPTLVARLMLLSLRVGVSRAFARSREPGLVTLLPDGGTVAIVGGGPSGCACAIRLLQRAEAAGRDVRVLLYEGKTFERHYNQCVGVLSPPLEEFLEKYLHLNLPENLTRGRIAGYELHSGDHAILLRCPDGSSPTYAARRLEFDDFLLRKAMRAGAWYQNCRVMGIEFVRTAVTDEVRIYSESGFERADVVVIACGLDDGILARLEALGRRGYWRPRRVLKSYITKLEASPDFIRERLGNIIHAYLPPTLPLVEFGAVTPKGDHLTMNIAGRKVTSEDLDRFLELPEVRRFLPPFRRERLDYYEGRFPISPTRHAFGHRRVTVGDATGWMRSFKGKGINTAVITGVAAADTILDRGVDSRALRVYEERCRDMRSDSFYGACARILCNLTLRLGLFGDVIDIARRDARVHSLLYRAVSGEDSFRNILVGFIRIGFPFTMTARLFSKKLLRAP